MAFTSLFQDVVRSFFLLHATSWLKIKINLIYVPSVRCLTQALFFVFISTFSLIQMLLRMFLISHFFLHFNCNTSCIASLRITLFFPSSSCQASSSDCVFLFLSLCFIVSITELSTFWLSHNVLFSSWCIFFYFLFNGSIPLSLN